MGQITSDLLKVGILVPVFNAERYLFDCFHSIELQTYKNIAVYAVDDNSSDHSVEVLSTYLNIKWFKHADNKGFARTFNDAANLAIADNCDYIFTLCNDDKLHPEAIERMIRTAEANPEAAWISCYGQMFGNDDQIMKVNSNPELEDFKYANQLLSFALFKASVWERMGGYDEKFAMDLGLKSAYEDWELWIRLIKAGYTFKVIPEPLYWYRMREGQLHHTLHPHHSELVQYLNIKHFS